mmetsp:Transcript_29788/g.41141  ORF Transcript_29788/g.41141 Transcript_29788/m.41141 type:complete len:285 (+) Transcript_29788:121-975(+)|eukprot:CAMPEP_0196580368 /NCGR_PEP_ID=MMETSP1081-20130531/28589_1 /TAXON_ID=36882 /ORGANISM="Pyramimonas amylifera, Strain CCMP720" /LENGTH=284 /DNA_ID=CAMNT_0041900219 /DNA_START=115 /DNA_END=969 /DNA_ORIENTATION=+
MLYLIGLGLGDEKDITVRGLEAVKSCSKLYLEMYTSILLCKTEKLEELYGIPVEVADREKIEQGIDVVLEEARDTNIGMLIVGDPFGATTHSDLVIRAGDMGVEVKVIHNASIMNAIGACGLQLYRFGQTVSICFFTDTWRPDSFYDRVKENRALGLHTLCLLDIRVKEPDMEAMCRGKKGVYEPPRYMTVNQCIDQLLEIEANKKEGVYSAETMCVGVARIGTNSQSIVSGTMQELLAVDFGPPLHSFVIPGEMHPMEEEMLGFFRAKRLDIVKEPVDEEDRL